MHIHKRVVWLFNTRNHLLGLIHNTFGGKEHVGGLLFVADLADRSDVCEDDRLGASNGEIKWKSSITNICHLIYHLRL